MTRRRLSAFVFLLVIVNLLVGVFTLPAGAGVTSGTQDCTRYVVVVSAMPLELDPLLAQANADLNDPVMLNNRPFVVGTLDGLNVIMGLTGIGPENAQATMSQAFAHFRCGNGSSQISDVVFSGVSGGDYIGDVFVPDNWSNDGAAPVANNPRLLRIARKADASDPPKLDQSTPPGDIACVCDTGITDQTQVPITIQHTPTVEFGGAGLTTDPFGGRTLPCPPTGDDIFGCTPCRELDHGTLGQAQGIAQNGPSFLETSFFTDYMNSTTPPGKWVSSDEETAVVAAVSASNKTPFIGFRAASDGGGDPLHLPGFPSEFFVYRQLAANNAAAMALSFLHQFSVTR